jgi:hypothetical protein
VAFHALHMHSCVLEIAIDQSIIEAEITRLAYEDRHRAKITRTDAEKCLRSQIVFILAIWNGSLSLLFSLYICTLFPYTHMDAQASDDGCSGIAEADFAKNIASECRYPAYSL